MRCLPTAALTGVIFALNAFAFAAAPQVEAVVVGSTTNGGVFTLSPQGGHIAFVGQKGAQAFVSIDGVESRMYDEIFGPTGQSFYHPPKATVFPPSAGGQNSGSLSAVIFSADGAHHAYAARIGNEYVVIHDGKEVGRGPREALDLAGNALTLSPTGRLVYWNETKSENGLGRWRLMVSGKPGPWSGNSILRPVFSGDDSRHAYTASKVANYQEHFLVVDGKDAGYVGRDPLFTADGKSVLSVRTEPGMAVLLDGKPVITALNIDKVIVAPAGGHWGAIVRTRIVGGLGVSSFFLDGREVPGTEGARSAWFSPDGKHHAAAVVNAATKQATMFLDGKPGKPFQNITDAVVKWTPDHSKFIYAAVREGRNVLVVNDEVFPMDAMMGFTPVVTASAGSRYGFATQDATSRIFSVVVDGQSVLPPAVSPVNNTLTFSPDGSRYGFFVSPVGRGDVTGLVLDGVSIEGLAPVPFGKWLQMDLVAPAFAFSRDGKHVAYLARGADPQTHGLYVDGKLAFPTTRVAYFPTFTPDGQHLLWATPGPNANNAPTLIVYADGREAVRANGQFFSNCGGVWSQDEKGVVTFFAAEGDVVKRFRITPATDSSLATMVTEVAEARTKALAEAEAKKKADAEAAAQAKAQQEAAGAKAKADAEAAQAAKLKARQDALDAKKKAREDALKAKSAK